ncbi:MAG: GNAT family N-acetyltransferase [Sciscionella sp.]
MSDLQIRLLAEDEWRAASTLFSATLHSAPVDDAGWPQVRGRYQPDRSFGAFEGTVLVGTARSFDAELTVPGGAHLPMAAVSDVGVRADRTRRGVLTAMMRAQLASVAEHAVPVASLRASEAVIYGRFGYGVASRARSLTLDPRRVTLSATSPVGGEIELLERDKLLARLPELYAAQPHRPGMITRPKYWWSEAGWFLTRPPKLVRGVVHRGARGVDGFATYTIARAHGAAGTMRVEDLHCGTAEAFGSLWRFLLSVDLVHEVTTAERALDEPVELLLTDSRAWRTTGVTDETWLRLVDVPTALRAREYGEGSVVIEVCDRLLPANSGCYRLGPDGVAMVDRRPQLTLDVDALAMLYLGDRSATQLAVAGRLAVLDPAALPVADRVFATDVAPWCGTFF